MVVGWRCSPPKHKNQKKKTYGLKKGEDKSKKATLWWKSKCSWDANLGKVMTTTHLEMV
jgi:hypothetical protein